MGDGCCPPTISRSPSAINQEIACAILQAAGYTVDVVEDGAAAVHAVMKGSYALVLMDVQMPVMDGVRQGSASEHCTARNATCRSSP